MSIIVDTGVFWSPEAMERLRRRRDVLVPSIVFVERARQLEEKDEMTAERFALRLRQLRWRVAPYTHEEAMRTLRLAPLEQGRWRRMARDALIAGHVGQHDVLWTFNGKDFRVLGLPERQIVDLDADGGP
ncbi:MAG: type II toxin-antitoxin system VapC family toxin [Thermoplasmatota archaeon]